MSKSRDAYRIVGDDIPGLVSRLNFVLAQISARLDKLEGIRGELETAGGITAEGEIAVNDSGQTKIHSMK